MGLMFFFIDLSTPIIYNTSVTLTFAKHITTTHYIHLNEPYEMGDCYHYGFMFIRFIYWCLMNFSLNNLAIKPNVPSRRRSCNDVARKSSSNRRRMTRLKTINI